MTSAFVPRTTPLLILLGSIASCTVPNKALEDLQAENEKLKADVARLEAAAEAGPDPLTTIGSFTVGLAASEKEFDESAFEKMLNDNLGTAAQEQTVKVLRESDSRQVHKIRGMLIQQYLAADEIPILVTNLSFKLRDANHAFKIGGQVVPRSGIRVAPVPSGKAVNALHAGAIKTRMRRGAGGSFEVPFQELGGGNGTVQIKIREAEILDTERAPRAERQGDLAFNWRLNLEKVQVYRIEGFRGDVGKFLSNMRYSGANSAIGKYQTLRDSVFLFGYGNYVTGLVNQLRTPARISKVEVMAIDKDKFDKIAGRMTEDELNEVLGSGSWQDCKFVNFSNSEKVWERPSGIGFPFVSRQISGEDKRVFYIKYGSDGSVFIGDFER